MIATSLRKDQTLLLVDHIRINELLQPYLEHLGRYEVITAESSREALEILDQHIPDLIVSEVLLPEMDGYELLKEIRQNERTSSIPFIFLSARGQNQDIIKGLDLGAKVFMTKPFEPEIILAQIKALLPEASLVPFEVSLNEIELKVLQFVVKGLANRDIAEELNIRENDVEFCVSSMQRITNLHSRDELVSWAIENHLE